MAIWSDDTINRLAAEAELEVATEIPCITKRISLNIRALNSLYNLPDDVFSIRRITWLGKKLEPKAFRGILKYPIVNPAGVIGAFDAAGFSIAFFVSASDSQPESGSPYQYFYSGFGENIIKLFPTPANNLVGINTNLYSSNTISSCCVVEYYAFPDVTGNSYRLPVYMARRIIKAFTLFKLLSQEGPGQDLIGAERWKKIYDSLLGDFRRINNGVFVARVRTRTPNANSFATQISRPRLPSNFGTMVGDS